MVLLLLQWCCCCLVFVSLATRRLPHPEPAMDGFSFRSTLQSQPPGWNPGSHRQWGLKLQVTGPRILPPVWRNRKVEKKSSISQTVRIETPSNRPRIPSSCENKLRKKEKSHRQWGLKLQITDPGIFPPLRAENSNLKTAKVRQR